MAIVDHTPGFAEVADNWTGSVTVTIGAVSATVTPTRGSAASVWIDLIKKCELLHGGDWYGWSTSASKLVIAHDVSFTLTASGSTQSNLGIPASASGTEVVGTSPHIRGTYPMTLKFSGFQEVKRDGGQASDGEGSTPLIWNTGDAQIQILDTWANCYAINADVMGSGDLFLMDLWIGGRTYGRYIVTGASMSRVSATVDYTQISLQCSGVAE